MIDEIKRALLDPQNRSLLREHAGRYKRGMSAEQFLDGTGFSSGAAAGHSLGLKMGLKSKASRTFALPTAALNSVLSLLCAMAELGIYPKEILESVPEKKLTVMGIISSSPWHFQGNLEISIKRQAHGVIVEALASFPGQMFAWGAGGRLVSRIEKLSLATASKLENGLVLNIKENA